MRQSLTKFMPLVVLVTMATTVVPAPAQTLNEIDWDTLVHDLSAQAQNEFDDVKDSVHEPAIGALAYEGFLEGTECGERQFCPGEPALRWTTGVWILRSLNEKPSWADSRFSDVDSGSWWSGYVERLAELGITKGCATNPLQFCPYETVNREQMASFLVRAFDLDAGSPAGFIDISSSVHSDSINALAAARITAGCSTDSSEFCPDERVTRGQMASFLARAKELVPLPERPKTTTTTTAPSDLYTNWYRRTYTDPIYDYTTEFASLVGYTDEPWQDPPFLHFICDTKFTARLAVLLSINDYILGDSLTSTVEVIYRVGSQPPLKLDWFKSSQTAGLLDQVQVLKLANFLRNTNEPQNVIFRVKISDYSTKDYTFVSQRPKEALGEVLNACGDK